MTKQCKRCGRVLDLSEFYAHPGMADGHLSFCKVCVKDRIKRQRHSDPRIRERDRARSRTPQRREVQRAYWARFKARNPEGYRLMRWAQLRLKRAIRGGAVQRPDTCEACGASGAIEGAHRDYAHPLDVRWLCPSCHRQWDNNTPKVPF